MQDKKEKGDEGEDYVNQIAYKSLLRYWCYPNPKDEQGDKKEICDLLVLFKDICIIFSVKNYEFTGDYEKYFRKTIDKAIKQIFGAERKLFDYPRPIYIKHPDRPEELFKKEKFRKIYRVIVNLGEGVEMYSPAHLAESGKFTTIFDKDTFETILNELDTISDFVKYLEAREEFISSKNMMQWLGREKDLFAAYIRNRKQYPPEFFKEANLVVIDFDGEWEKFLTENHKSIEEKKKRDKDSYFLDELAGETLTKLPQGDLIAREFLSLNRFERRQFMDVFNGFKKTYQVHKTMTTGYRYVEIGEYGIVFFFCSNDIAKTGFLPTGLNTAMVGHILNSKYAKKKILGLGITNGGNSLEFKFIEIDGPLDSQLVKEATALIKKLGWFKNFTFSRHQDTEYPD